MYFIYGNDQYMNEKKLNHLLKELQKEKQFNVIKFSLLETSKNEILSELYNYDIFGNDKIVIIYDCWFLTEDKIKLKSDILERDIQRIIDANNEEIKVIFMLNTEKISKRLKITKYFQTKCQSFLMKTPSEKEIFDFICKKLTQANRKFDPKAINYFISEIPINMFIISNELKKLINSNTDIDIEFIKENVSKYFEFNIFELVNSVLNGDVNGFLKEWHDYKAVNYEIISFLALLSNSFITLRNILILSKRKLSQSEIALELNINPYRVKKMYELQINDINKINQKIKDIYLLNAKILKGSIDDKIIPELELLKLVS